jgi:4-diphosphocytidyl-2-C-methyl-D-erythritol kinase
VILFPNCKINLGLHITGKRTDGFHDLETVFYPIPLNDAIELIHQPDHQTPFQISVSGLSIGISQEENICYKAWQILKKDFPAIPDITMHLHKRIPTGAGLGGGSADGAFTLMLLNQKFKLGLSDEALKQYALELGSDCPFFILNRPAFAKGRGEILEEVSLNLSSYRIMLVNPGIIINTGWAFKQIQPQPAKIAINEIVSGPVSSWKNSLKNDFEEPVFLHHPEVKEIRDQLYKHGALYASMSGTGSTVYGIFDKEEELLPAFPPSYFVKLI